MNHATEKPASYAFKRNVLGARCVVEVEAEPVDAKLWGDATLPIKGTAATAHAATRAHLGELHHGVALLGPHQELIGWIEDPRHATRDEAVASYLRGATK